VSNLVLWIQTVLLPALGPSGLLLVAVLDASFLSLPEINDILVVTAAARPPHSIAGPVIWATLGSTLGSAIVWWFGRRGADASLIQRLGSHRLERAREAFRRWGGLALFVPALSPPPMPFKLFVLAAGVSGYPFWRFVLVVTVGRVVRYVFWALLGVLFGERAIGFLKSADSWTVAHLGSLLVGALIVTAGAAVWWLTVRSRHSDRPREDPVV